MDIATLIGFLAASGIIATAILLGPNALIFLNIPGLLIVIGGTFGATLMKFPITHMFGAFKVALKAFIYKNDKPTELIREGIEMAQIARKEGFLGLENREVQNEFLQKGITLCVDGHDPELVRRMLSN